MLFTSLVVIMCFSSSHSHTQFSLASHSPRMGTVPKMEISIIALQIEKWCVIDNVVNVVIVSVTIVNKASKACTCD